MRRAAIVSPLRTAIGAFGGSLQKVATEDLGAAVIKAVLAKTGLDPELIEDVVFAQSFPNGETPCTGRYLALHAGLPLHSGGMQLDRRCGSGLQAVISAAMMVQTGAADVVLAGGIESMSNVEYYTTSMRWGSKAGSVKFAMQFNIVPRGLKIAESGLRVCEMQMHELTGSIVNEN